MLSELLSCGRYELTYFWVHILLNCLPLTYFKIYDYTTDTLLLRMEEMPVHISALLGFGEDPVQPTPLMLVIYHGLLPRMGW
jgi:hypothetical protein